MEIEEIQDKLKEALQELLQIDRHLFIEKLSEQSITHRLALHLTPKFPDYDVDCEYNGDVDSDMRRKQIIITKERAEELGIINEETNDDDEEIVKRVFPDIIVHKRGNNKHNILVIEAKKSNNMEENSVKYDVEKLERFTSIADNDGFKYMVGTFVEFVVGKKPSSKVRWFREGYEFRKIGEISPK